ncbi:MAG: hypothetical protein ACJ746_00590 [Bryobacteraceae bacterium]
MKTFVLFLPFTLVLAMAWLISNQQQQIKTLQRELDSRSSQQKATISQLQCSEAARKFLPSQGWTPEMGGDYKNHFNSKLGKCFVLASNYLINEDFETIALYDALEGRLYASFNGHRICEIGITGKPRKCVLDSGNIWFDGDDDRTPADLVIGFRGSRYGGGAGNEDTRKDFLKAIKPFMTE